MKLYFAFLVLLSFFTGCATVSPQQKAEIQETVPTCCGQRECEVKWAAARQWVLDNIKMKIQTYSDDLIETYSSPPDSPLLAARITKTPNPNAKSIYAIGIYVSCNNLFGCVPDVHAALLSFNNYVNSIRVEDESQYATLLIEKGFEAPFAGVYFISLNDKTILKGVVGGSPAKKAGLKTQDVVTRFDDQVVETQEQFKALLTKVQFGDKKKIEILRNGIPMSFVLEFPSTQEVESIVKSQGVSKGSKADESIEEKLETLNRLLDKGLITKKEYDKKKAELLSNY